ncbi:protein cab-1-like isoform X2 [Teleopsis dalmanni]|uniref:protein cab-1-like isoform X2 n=2 Tax=Teleopsis dalmanni TaxID=139649 RepID=UPI0018CFEAC2|nr:protein cab-1-like isoform X2 [Teleopsis dalmanni]
MYRVGFVTLTLVGMVLLNIMALCEMSVYPGLRRKPLHQSLQQSFDVPSDFLAQLMEENARRRLQQQFIQQLELINMKMNSQRQRQEQWERYRQLQLQQQLRQQQMLQMEDSNENENENESETYGNDNLITDDDENNNNQYDQMDKSNSEFSFKYSPSSYNNFKNVNIFRERPPFAVGPTDPRFYEADTSFDENDQIVDNRDDTKSDELDSRALEDYEEYVPADTKQVNEKTDVSSKVDTTVSDKTDSVKLAPAPVETTKVLDSSASSSTTFHRIKPQTAAAAAVAGITVGSMKPAIPQNFTHTKNVLLSKIQKDGKSISSLNTNNEIANQEQDQMVLRQHLGVDADMGSMYLVALIAGVSAALTVGIVALGITWMHNKTKAAADVEYPAYGVTGPNKDISPSSGDRKLAQSAQMYHYQHQKQQIIAMENRQADAGNCGLSDVESDDDNDEEGDYTVYECPGLAPTGGEMEVKNPLFLDETPLTPSTAVPQQPQKKIPGPNKTSTTTATSTIGEEKKSKKSKK